jgi:hypothetical protein
MKFSNRRDAFDPDKDLLPALEKAAHSLHAPEMVLLINRPLTDEETKQLAGSAVDLVPVAQFTQGDIVDEHFFLYKVSLGARS